MAEWMEADVSGAAGIIKRAVMYLLAVVLIVGVGAPVFMLLIARFTPVDDGSVLTESVFADRLEEMNLLHEVPLLGSIGDTVIGILQPILLGAFPLEVADADDSTE